MEPDYLPVLFVSNNNLFGIEFLAILADWRKVDLVFGQWPSYITTILYTKRGRGGGGGGFYTRLITCLNQTKFGKAKN
jgi:hypothetical protein